MASTAKAMILLSPAIEPELKEFIDEVLVPMLVRDAMHELQTEIHLATVAEVIAQSASEGEKS